MLCMRLGLTLTCIFTVSGGNEQCLPKEIALAMATYLIRPCPRCNGYLGMCSGSLDAGGTRFWDQDRGNQRMTSIDTMLREVLVTLKEEQACLELWLKDKSASEDVCRGIEKSLTNISEALGKLTALDSGVTNVTEES